MFTNNITCVNLTTYHPHTPHIHETPTPPDTVVWPHPSCSFPAWLQDIRWRDLAAKHEYRVQRTVSYDYNDYKDADDDRSEVTEGVVRRRPRAKKNAQYDRVYRSAINECISLFNILIIIIMIFIRRTNFFFLLIYIYSYIMLSS